MPTRDKSLRTRTSTFLTPEEKRAARERLLLAFLADPSNRVRIGAVVEINATSPAGLALPCWTWRGAKNSKGYGIIRINNVVFGAHQVYYFLAHRRLPPVGLELDHLCRTPVFVNARHLEAVTRKENVRRIHSRNAFALGSHG